MNIYVLRHEFVVWYSNIEFISDTGRTRQIVSRDRFSVTTHVILLWKLCEKQISLLGLLLTVAHSLNGRSARNTMTCTMSEVCLKQDVCHLCWIQSFWSLTFTLIDYVHCQWQSQLMKNPFIDIVQFHASNYMCINRCIHVTILSAYFDQF